MRFTTGIGEIGSVRRRVRGLRCAVTHQGLGYSWSAISGQWSLQIHNMAGQPNNDIRVHALCLKGLASVEYVENRDLGTKRKQKLVCSQTPNP